MQDLTKLAESSSLNTDFKTWFAAKMAAALAAKEEPVAALRRLSEHAKREGFSDECAQWLLDRADQLAAK